MLRVVNLTIFAFSLLLPILNGTLVAAEILPPHLIFTEVKVRLDSTNLADYDEFIEIYNPSIDPVDLAGYGLEYFNTTNPTASQQPTQKPLFDYLLGAGSSLTLAKQPIQIANAKQSPLSSLSDTGGRLRLVTTEGQVVDEVAWTNSQSNATATTVYPAIVYQCNASTALCNSNRGQSIGRNKDADGHYVLINPTWKLGVTTPESSELIAYPEPEPEPEVPAETPAVPPADPAQASVTCEGMVISELLPNPAGVDSGHEFIELYNTTNDIINLKGCALQTSTSTKKYSLPDLAVNPKTYLIFNDAVSGLTLTNTSGGTAWLLTPTEELSTIQYPGGIDDDAAWAFVDGIWQITYSPTPAATNVAQPLKPCSDGQVRNPDTNRCQAPVVASVAVLTPCKTGQERNPETNRCRAIGSTVNTVVACKAGQERNPETSRCRNAGSDDGLTPCAEGQERNPDTNRCRKVSSGSGQTLGAVTDVKTPTSPNHPKWWLAIFAVIAALGYAVYEWRKDIALWYRRVVRR